MKRFVHRIQVARFAISIAACAWLAIVAACGVSSAGETSTGDDAAPCCRERKFGPTCLPPEPYCGPDAPFGFGPPWLGPYGYGFNGFGYGPWLGYGGYPWLGASSWLGNGWLGGGLGYWGGGLGYLGGGWGAFWNPYASFWPYGHGPGYRPGSGIWYSWPSNYPLHFSYPFLNAGPGYPASPDLWGRFYW